MHDREYEIEHADLKRRRALAPDCGQSLDGLAWFHNDAEDSGPVEAHLIIRVPLTRTVMLEAVAVGILEGTA